MNLKKILRVSAQLSSILALLGQSGFDVDREIRSSRSSADLLTRVDNHVDQLDQGSLIEKKKKIGNVD